MKLISWNVQWCRGVDGRVDPDRIARTARALADFDVLCLQEVAVNFSGLDGSLGEDQVAKLCRALPGYSPHYGAATDVDDGKGGRSLFGNLILARLPVLQVFRHLLPWPRDPAVPSMQRLLLEAVVATPSGPLRIMTTHLEYYSALQRGAQVNALRDLHLQACTQSPGRPSGDGPLLAHPRPAAAVLTGDFNFTPEDPDHARVTAALPAGAPPFCDAWPIAHPHLPHPPTAGVHENSWAKTPFCCDFAFVTADIASRVRSVSVDGQTQASDHQPVLLELSD